MWGNGVGMPQQVPPAASAVPERMYINGANFDPASGGDPPQRLVVVANRLPVSAYKVRITPDHACLLACYERNQSNLGGGGRSCFSM